MLPDKPQLNNKEELLIRLKKIEGQIRGLQKMILQDRKCHEVLAQFSAINGAMRQVSIKLMETYIESCLQDKNVLPHEIRENLNYFIKTISR
ncbi:MAG: metal-sensitive transcriptional regulator [Thermodesulfovibrionales bacterium]|nr:metal-sensitive transcriptional regulator [Thermodesulfovibrionales bacterium]